MQKKKTKRDFLSLFDLEVSELNKILKRSFIFKKSRSRYIDILKGKGIVLLFEKSSTRTRVSFEVAINQLGGYAIYLSSKDTQLSRGETISDTALVLSKYVDAIVMRTFSHSSIREMASSATVPVINALSDLLHPCQALADVMTFMEFKKEIQNKKMAYIGDGNNVANSLIEAASLFRFELVVACPEGYEPDEKILEVAKRHHGGIKITNDPVDAVRYADAIYTDVWVSMGHEAEAEKRKLAFKGFQVNEELISCAKPDAIVLHCLPAHRGEEISAGVIDGAHSAVWVQAENRLHTQKALLEFLLKGY